MRLKETLTAASVAALIAGCAGGPEVIVPVDERATLRAETCGIDRDAIDRTVDPADDFYAYATGRWQTDGTVADALEAAARQSLADAGTKTARFVETYRAADPRDARGAAPVLQAARTLLEERDRRALATAAAEAALRQGTTPFRVGAYPDPDDPGTTSLIVASGGAPLGGPDDYDALEEQYKERIAATLALLGVDRPERLAGRVFDFERSLAQAIAAADKEAFTERGIGSLSRLRGGDPWAAYFATLGIDAEAAKLRDISALSATAGAWRNAGRDTIAAYLAFHRVSDVADFLPPEYGGVRDPAVAERVGERIFEAEEGALLRGFVDPETRRTARIVGEAVLGPQATVVIAGGAEAYRVPDGAEDATAEAVENAALARGVSRVARAGGETEIGARLASDLTALPRFDPATNALDLPAGLLRGPVYGTPDVPAAFGALGGLILRQRGLDDRQAAQRAFAAYETASAGTAERLCGLNAGERFLIGYAQGSFGGDPEAVNDALSGLPPFRDAYIGK